MQRVEPATAVPSPAAARGHLGEPIAFVLMVAALAIAPLYVYPMVVMQGLCFALFACAFNLLIGYGGLLSFGHALYFGWASYLAADRKSVV